MILTILPEDHQDNEPDSQRIQRIQQELDELRDQAMITITITAQELALLEAQGYLYDFETGTLLITSERISPN